MKLTAYHVNAFTANSKGGNPAGIVLDADKLSEKQMLSIAKKVGFSETAFVSSSSVATKKLRFFTSTEEVDLCGHATIASWAYMRELETVKDGDYTQETKAGILKVSVRGKLVYMQQTAAEFYEKVDKSEIGPVLGITDGDFNESLEPQIVSTGLRDLFVPIRNEDVLASLNPDLDAITKMSKRYDITGLHVFCLLGSGNESLLAARNFAPLYGIDEEAATGTSNGATLCYLKEEGVLPKRAEYRIEQGRSMGQLSYIYGKFIDDIVWVGGEATFIDKLQLEA